MFTLLRNVHSRPSPRWAASSSTAARQLSSSIPRHAAAEEQPQDAELEAGEAEEPVEEEESGRKRVPGYLNWLKSDGAKYRNAHMPRNWLGGNVSPFPLNPSFKPPTPISDRMRTTMWEQFVANPSENGVRQLAERYGLSIKRVDAILRLKGLEQHWIKEKKPIQTGFVTGMEKILGAKEVNVRYGMPEGSETLGEDATIADSDYDANGNDEARYRYQRMFWEPYVEGSKPDIPRQLERARAASDRHKLLAELVRSDPELLGEDLSEDHEFRAPFIVERGNRPSIKFVDVGGKFLDVKDRRRRMQEGERRSQLGKKRRTRKLRMLEAAALKRRGDAGLEPPTDAEVQVPEDAPPVATA